MQAFLDAVNAIRPKCATPYCKGSSYIHLFIWSATCNPLYIFIGMLVPVHHTTERLGGAASIQICCSGCKKTIHFSTSRLCGDIKQRTPVVSLSLRLASFLLELAMQGIKSFSNATWDCMQLAGKASMMLLRWFIHT